MEFFDAFGVDWFKLAAQVLNFLLLLYLLNRFVYKPMLLPLLEERRKRIEQGLQDAEQAKRDRELARAEREAALDQARTEAQAMIARATKIAEDSRAETVAQARAEAERVTQRARDEIEAEKERAVAEIRAEVADLAILAAGRLLREEIDGQRQRRLVEDFLAEVQPPAARDARS
ncbi:MAG: F0F1 ATP synthase subunit B [Chloroflexota bacterium]|nr:F0F1 ATP synthase subunit B [Chloroflexota bacterium]